MFPLPPLPDEIWLSILVRKLLKRGNFTSLEDLRDHILAFIAYYNALQCITMPQWRNPSSGPTRGWFNPGAFSASV